MKKTDLGDATAAADPTAIERLQPNFSESEKTQKGDIRCDFRAASDKR